jgi:hypothetical protein
MKEDIYKQCGLSSLLKDGKIEIPDYIKHINIDIGLSVSAPNSALWLNDTDDRIVFGFEPSPENIIHLEQGTFINPNQMSIAVNSKTIRLNHLDIKYFGDRFKLLKCALDDISSPRYVSFYITDDRNPGCSSLRKPTDKLPYKVKKEVQVPVISFYDFLKHLPWERFPYIEMVKTDTQGKDLDVLKSAKKYIERFVFLHVENSTNGEYEGSHTEQEINEFLENKGFELLSKVSNDSLYLNKKYKKESLNLNRKTV